MGAIYGYARVSARDQKEDRQMMALRQIPVREENIYLDRQSGKDFNRPMYQRLLKKLRPDDLLYIKSIDRLGRDYEEILKQWRVLTKEKSIDIVVLDMPLLDTRRGKDLIGTFLSDIVLQILSFVAENERKNIKERQKEGIIAAQKRGVKFGRPRKEVPPAFKDAYQGWISGKLLTKQAAELCGMSESTFYRRARERKADRAETGSEAFNKKKSTLSKT